jgi:hypothetical protein
MNIDAMCPATLEEVTAGWLADVTGLPIASAELTVIGRGEGFLGQLGRVSVGYDGPAPDDAPSSVIVKLPTVDPGGRAIGMMMRVWEREASFYRELAPDVRTRVPQVFANVVGADAYALVLEDLAPLHAADQVAGASPAQARRVIDELASLHAQWWDHPRLREFTWLPGLDSPITASLGPMFDMGFDQFQQRFAERVAPRTLNWAQSFVRQIPDLIARYLDEPATLVHGDFRLDNMFFDPSGRTDPADDDARFALVDWQMAMRAPGGSDLVYFIVTNLTPELRRSMERELVDRYVDGLHRHGVTGPYATSERLWRGYLEGVLFYTVTFGGGLLTIDPANERGVKLFDELVMRTYTAADDLDAGTIVGL